MVLRKYGSGRPCNSRESQSSFTWNWKIHDVRWILFYILLAGSICPLLADEDTDFDFVDKLHLDSQVRVAAHRTLEDDEDLMNDDGSATYDYSGTTTVDVVTLSKTVQWKPIFPHTTTPTLDGNDIHQYNIVINFTSVYYTSTLSNTRSSEFTSLASSIRRAVESLFTSTPGHQTVEVLQFRSGSHSSPSVMATFDLHTSGYYDRVALFNVLNHAVNRRSIAEYSVSPIGFEVKLPNQTSTHVPIGPKPTCAPFSEFHCNNGQCIDISQKCDGQVDCSDRSDEYNCPPERHTCSSSEFQCENGQCIAVSYLCDEHDHCSDGSDEDEEHCPPASCSSHEFRCHSDECIDARRLCDGFADCDDESDEDRKNCNDRVETRETCSSQEFSCINGNCIDIRRVCDGANNCGDGSDEQQCATPVATRRPYPPGIRCSSSQFQCRDGGCIERYKQCDGRADCSEEEDESEEICPIDPRQRVCSSRDFQCKDGSCIAMTRRCDKHPDCNDYSDELDCVTPPSTRLCSPSEFRCADGTCIHQNLRCNNAYDCPDRTDETQDCETISVSASPGEMRIREGMTATFVCRSQGNLQPQLRWSRRSQALPQQAIDDYNGRLEIPEARVSDSGEYTCSTVGTRDTHTAKVVLYVDVIVGPTITAPGQRQCYNSDEFMCNNRVCVPPDYRCDGDYDCTDRSDEVGCQERDASCEPNEFKCLTSGKCILKIWMCDGDDDCGGDKSDENGCDTFTSRSGCRADEFQCTSGSQCIPAGYQCDGERDCQDSSDESGCSKPTPVKVPPREIMVQEGETIVIDCEAIGIPPPLIVWRLNWGHVGHPPRVSYETDRIPDRPGNPVRSRGVLTIRQASKEDEGAYTCEAINSMGSIFVEPDTIVHVLPPRDICQRGYFNSDARTFSQCIKCFCFGLTDNCKSSSLFISEITVGNTLDLVNRDDRQPFASSGSIRYVPTSREFSIKDYSRTVRGSSSYYWSLPKHFLGNKVTSYGGKLSYAAFYSTTPGRQSHFESGPDVIVNGNDITLYHSGFPRQFANVEQKGTVPFLESSWTLDELGTRRASRENLLTVLQNLDYILIKSYYDRYQEEVRLGQISLTTTSPHSTGLGQAVLVEECTCPDGYTGPSCDLCSPGFRRTEGGQYIGQCSSGCNCHGHSEECDPRTGLCRGCLHNTEGDKCDRCKKGFYGDATSGNCLPCPCPTPDDPNQSAECYRDNDGQVTCQGCPTGYTGRRCESCLPGYQGDPSVPGGTCRSSTQYCDPKGSTSTIPDPYTGQCACKQFAEGPTCSRCRQNSFYPADVNPFGCVPCFCMGVTQSCASTTHNRAQVTVTFRSDAQGVVLTDRFRKQSYTDGITVNSRQQEITYKTFHHLQPDEYYWSLPAKFLKNKVTSYGGNLRYTIQHLPGLDTRPTRYPDVEISGNDIVLEYVHDIPIPSNRPTSVVVPFYENKWRRADGTMAPREHLLMVLADLEFILIKAKYTEDTVDSSLKDVSLDVAENRNTGQERAYPVEECACPPGYRGLSCETCAIGYRRSGGGLYLGTCEPCDCFGHSTDCDSATGLCKNCKHNTAGDLCDVCAPGFYGDATRGQPNDCQPCPCPLTSAPNQFTQECYLSDDNQVTCSGCPPGHTGRQCERCISGYRGNPRSPGDSCRPNSNGGNPNGFTDDDKPKVTINPARLSKSSGESVTFQCAVQGQGPINVQWIRADGRPLPRDRSVVGRDNSLRIRDLQATDSGRYVCVATNAFGRSQLEAELSVSVERHLNVIVQEPKHQIMADGATVQFFCIGESPNVYTIAWTRKDGRPLDPRAVDDGQGALTIRGIRREDQGIYLCTGSDFYSIATDEGQLTIGGSNEPPSARIEPNYVTANVGESVSFHCIASGFPAPWIEWSGGRDGIMPIDTIIEGDTLRFHSVTMKHEGEYLCAVSNQAGEATARATLLVQGEVPGVEVIIDKPELRLRPGEEARLDCIGRSRIRVEAIEWTKFGDHLPPGAHQVDGQLVIPNCRQEFGGRYVCTIYLVNGEKNVAYSNIIIESDGGSTSERVEAPKVTMDPENQIINEGSTGTIRCVVSGHPTPDIRWSRRHGVLGHNHQVYGDVLRINEASFGDRDTYVCEATNVAGSDRGVATVEVKIGHGFWTTVPPDDRHEVTAVVFPHQIRVAAGQMAEFQCTTAGYPTPTIHWTREDGPMPEQHVVRDGLFRINRVRPSDAGVYKCVARTRMESAETTVQLYVLAPPVISVSPNMQTLRPGDLFKIQCTAHGTQPMTIEWSKVHGSLSPTASDHQGLLEIVSVTPTDSGRYRCVVVNDAGRAESLSELIVLAPPGAIVSPRTIHMGKGHTVEFKCEVTGSPQPRVQWTKEGGGNLPERHTVLSGTLTLFNIQPHDEGRYVCSVTNEVGSTRDYGQLIVTGSNVVNPVQDRREVLTIGDKVEINCAVTGEPRPTVRWIKVDGSLSSHIIVDDTYLIIPAVTEEDEGTYRCVASSVAGTVFAQVTLIVEMPPSVPVSRQSRTVSTGGRATLTCHSHGNPKPSVRWTKPGGELPRNHETQNGVLVIPIVRDEDFGEYVCTARNKFGFAEGIIVLQSGELVPYFSQNPVSYMSYQTIKDAYKTFDIEISFKPQATDGLILYNGQLDDGSGDFVSFGLRNRRAELRLDVGSGPAVIATDPIELDKWHNVIIKRDGKDVSLFLDGREFKGQAPGSFIGLDLTEKMYLGAVPDFQKISKLAAYNRGFVGCISRLVVSGTQINLGGEVLENDGVTDCPVCQYRPCRNGGSCRSAITETGFQCHCARGYSGTHCELVGEKCVPGVCEPKGKCHNYPTVGYFCACPVGVLGHRCEHGSEVTTPSFNSTSFVSYPSIRDPLFDVHLQLSFKAETNSNGLLLYNAFSQDGSGDFIAISIRDGHVHFQFDTGTGAADIRSREPVEIGAWTTVVAERSRQDGSLSINDGIAIKGQALDPDEGSSIGDTVGLNLKTHLFIGGVPQSQIRVSPSVGIHTGFVGCIYELVISGIHVDMINEALSFKHVSECSNGQTHGCADEPCLNGGHCVEHGDVFECMCPMGYSGTTCDRHTSGVIETSVEFTGNGYIELSQDLLPHESPFSMETIEFSVSTEQPNALLFWQGQPPNESGRGKDYISVALEHGRAVFSYELGSGPATIVSEEELNDGQEHHIKVERIGQQGTMTIDGFSDSRGESGGDMKALNTLGNIYLGGLPDFRLMTGSKYSQGLIGCISNVHLNDNDDDEEPLDLNKDAVSGVNVRPCYSS